jgi:hypothetical protein
MDAFHAEVKAQIGATETNIHRLSTQIDELICARQKERNTLARLWFMIVPVGKLPTELLVEIFALAAESDSSSMVVDRGLPAFGLDHPVRQALLLSQVCSSWRQIVTKLPRL